MRATPTFDVTHTSRRIVSAFASVAVALTMVRFAFGRRPRRADHDLDFVD